MSPISIAVAVLATLAASAAVLVGSAWLLVRAARGRVENEWRALDRERQREIGAVMRGRLRAARLAHPRAVPRRDRVVLEIERRARR